MKSAIAILAVIVLTSCTDSNNSDNDRSSSSKSDRASLQAIVEHDVNKLRKNDLSLDHYIVDTTHSSIQFSVRHWGIYDVVGWIESYEATVSYTRDGFTDAVVDAKLRPASIIMPNREMADNLKSPGLGFFDLQRYPEIHFTSTSTTMVDDSLYKMTGLMTINRIANEVVFDVSFNGFADPMAKGTPGFTFHGTFNLSDYELGNAEVLPISGLPVIDDEVRITGNVRLIWQYD